MTTQSSEMDSSKALQVSAVNSAASPLPAWLQNIIYHQWKEKKLYNLGRTNEQMNDK
jgi:hypothetical protein